MALAVVAVVFLVAWTVVAGRSSRTAGGAAEAGVPWADYASGVRVRIDGLANEKDCAGLQAEFDTADANNAATMARVGHNNADLMGYIDDAMRRAGCYR